MILQYDDTRDYNIMLCHREVLKSLMYYSREHVKIDLFLLHCILSSKKYSTIQMIVHKKKTRKKYFKKKKF